MVARRNGVGAETEPDEAVGVNEVRLVGRVSGTPEIRAMPSGDEVLQLRVVVRRPPEPSGRASRATGARAGRDTSRDTRPDGSRDTSGGKAGPDVAPRAAVDTIDVSCWTPVTRRAGQRLTDGDPVEVQGALHRRFYRAGASVQSRYDVVAAAVRRPAGGAGRGRRGTDQEGVTRP